MLSSVSDVSSMLLSQSRGHVARRTATEFCPQRSFLSALRPGMVADSTSS